ncbi:hypothetical protein GCM10023087_05590 [Microbacterium rhizosphaerae]
MGSRRAWARESSVGSRIERGLANQDGAREAGDVADLGLCDIPRGYDVRAIGTPHVPPSDPPLPPAMRVFPPDPALCNAVPQCQSGCPYP